MDEINADDWHRLNKFWRDLQIEYTNSELAQPAEYSFWGVCHENRIFSFDMAVLKKFGLRRI